MMYKLFAVALVVGVQGFIPGFYPQSGEWVHAVGIELVQNHQLELVRDEKRAVEVWKNLGGPEMAQLCVRPNTPIEALIGTLFLAGELAAGSHSRPRAMVEDLMTVCGWVARVPELLVNAASNSLFELGLARRDMEARLSVTKVMQYTPLANLHLVCGSRMSAIPSIAQVLVKSAAQRELGVFKSNAVLPSLEVFIKANSYVQGVRAIHDYSREQLIAGAADERHLQAYFDAMFKTVDQNGLFHQKKGVYFLTPVYLDARDKAGMQKFYMAGRALGLSLLYGVPSGRQLDRYLLNLVCNGTDDNILLEFRLVLAGFSEIIPPRLLNQLKIESDTVGHMLKGLAQNILSPRMLLQYAQLSLNEAQQNELSNTLSLSPEYPQLFVQLATGLKHLPVGGVASIVPAIDIGVAPFGSSVSVDEADHTVTLAKRGLGNQLIVALKTLV